MSIQNLLLEEVAQTLTALNTSGARVSIKHGAILTDYGYVLPNADGSWTACLKVTDPEYVATGDPYDD